MNDIYRDEDDAETYYGTRVDTRRIIMMDDDENAHGLDCNCPRCIAMEMDY